MIQFNFISCHVVFELKHFALSECTQAEPHPLMSVCYTFCDRSAVCPVVVLDDSYKLVENKYMLFCKEEEGGGGGENIRK